MPQAGIQRQTRTERLGRGRHRISSYPADEGLGRVHTTQCIEYERQQDETQEEHIKFVEAREDAPKALQPSEQPLDLVAPLVQLLVVFPWVDSGGEWGNNGSKSQLQCELARLVALVCTIHHYRQVLLLRPQAVEQLAALRCVVGLSRGKGEGHGRSSICGNHMNLGGPAAT